MNDQETQKAISNACQLWHNFNEQNWEAARRLLLDDFEAIWPQSREKIIGADNFISLNREYPGKGNIQFGDCRYGYDNVEHVHKVTMTVRINWTKPNGTKEELLCYFLF